MLKRMFLASRPAMWPWLVLMYMVGVGSAENYNLIVILELIMFTFPINYFLYGLNDVYDHKSDMHNARKENVLGIKLKEKEREFIKKTVWIPPVVFLIIAAFTQNLAHILIASIMIFFGVAYSHKTFRFKEKPVLDCITSGVGYTLPALIGYTTHSALSTLPAHVYAIALPYIGIHAYTTLADYAVDKKAGMNTIGVAWGKGAIVFTGVMFLAGAILLRNNTLLLSMLILSLFYAIVSLALHIEKQPEHFIAGSAVFISFGLLGMVNFILTVF